MKLKTTIFTAILATLLSINVQALEISDDCYDAALELSKGVARSYKVYDKKPAKVIRLELVSATEIREYSFTVIHGNTTDSYTIELENDSAFKCLLHQIEPTKIGG